MPPPSPVPAVRAGFRLSQAVSAGAPGSGSRPPGGRRTRVNPARAARAPCRRPGAGGQGAVRPLSSAFAGGGSGGTKGVPPVSGRTPSDAPVPGPRARPRVPSFGRTGHPREPGAGSPCPVPSPTSRNRFAKTPPSPVRWSRDARRPVLDRAVRRAPRGRRRHPGRARTGQRPARPPRPRGQRRLRDLRRPAPRGPRPAQPARRRGDPPHRDPARRPRADPRRRHRTRLPELHPRPRQRRRTRPRRPRRRTPLRTR